MRNQIKNVFNSAVSEVSILVIICCLIITALAMDPSGEWSSLAAGASIVGGVALVFLLSWATYKLITKKEVNEMPLKSRLIVETISRLLFMYWLYITLGLIPAIIWALFVIWDSVRSFRQAAS